MAERMKHMLAVLWLALVLPAAAAVADEALFWSVERDGRVAGYLLGTIHSEDPRVLDFRPEFLGQVGDCDVFAMELVPDLDTLQRLVAYMQLPEGDTLRAHLGEERYERVKAALERYGVSAEQAQRLKPWAAMMTLSVPPPSTGLFMDYALALRAQGMGLDLRGLEALEEQLGFLEALEPSMALELLDQAVSEAAGVDRVHREMVDAYLGGRLTELEEQAHAQLAALTPAARAWFVEQGVTERNRRMAQRMLGWLGEEACLFVAVGALHLPGEAGLIELLREGGYELRPQPSPLVEAPDAASTSTASGTVARQ
jgi:uncharacterized protein YbaP (TraB family)